MPLSLARLRQQSQAASAVRFGKPTPDAVDKLRRDEERRARQAERLRTYQVDIDDLVQSIHEYNGEHKRDTSSPAPQLDGYGNVHVVDPLNTEGMIEHIDLVRSQWTQLGREVAQERAALAKQLQERLANLRDRYRRGQAELSAVLDKQLSMSAGGKMAAEARRRFRVSRDKFKAQYMQLQQTVRAQYDVVGLGDQDNEDNEQYPNHIDIMN